MLLSVTQISSWTGTAEQDAVVGIMHFELQRHRVIEVSVFAQTSLMLTETIKNSKGTVEPNVWTQKTFHPPHTPVMSL